ncbi:MAG: methylmalonyl Co-A mutase-associated GTPase MeaB [Rhizobacter sp.]
MAAGTHTAGLVDRALAGDRRALARLLTLIDDDSPGAAAAAALMSARAGRAWVVGMTGVPGSGKSTLVDALLGAWLERGFSVAVIAIDPSSPLTGGAVLGDRIRMGAHGAHPNAFIRSFSARGELGGLSRAAAAAVDCFDAAGFDRIIVETVGTGQSETRIVALADTRVVVCPPGLGDDVQAIKAGTLEIADILAVSKGDLPLAEQTAREMREMLTLRRKPEPGAWQPRVLVVSAKSQAGLGALLGALEEHEALGHARRRRPPLAGGRFGEAVRSGPVPLDAEKASEQDEADRVTLAPEAAAGPPSMAAAPQAPARPALHGPVATLAALASSVWRSASRSATARRDAPRADGLGVGPTGGRTTGTPMMAAETTGAETMGAPTKGADSMRAGTTGAGMASADAGRAEPPPAHSPRVATIGGVETFEIVRTERHRAASTAADTHRAEAARGELTVGERSRGEDGPAEASRAAARRLEGTRPGTARLGAVPASAQAAAAALPQTREAANTDRKAAARLAALAERDGVCTTFGIAFVRGGIGHAEVSMTVDRRHTNFNGVCHGGVLFALADTAFGLASNSHGPVAVGIDAHITFQVPVGLGDKLAARATEVSRSRRIATYRVQVVRRESNGGETAISSFTGTVYVKARGGPRDSTEGTVP